MTVKSTFGVFLDKKINLKSLTIVSILRFNGASDLSRTDDLLIRTTTTFVATLCLQSGLALYLSLRLRYTV